MPEFLSDGSRASAVAILLGLTSAVQCLAAPAAPPNVLIVLADDQGWGDLSLSGNHDLSTPNIDRLARDGASFERFYVCPVCAPSRAEFLTGRYHPRTGVHGVSEGAERLALDERTIADIFRAAGYATGCFGKWHNGMQYPYHPRGRGFDSFVGFCSGHWGMYFDPELERDGVLFKSTGYITDIFTDEAIRFIEKHQNRPFFCFVPLCTPHAPMQVPDRYWDRFKEKPLTMDHPQADAHTRAALAMCEHIDDNVGRLLATLDALALTDKTIVIFFSDNGPNGRRWNGGMRGIKGSTDEGGVRVPCVIRYPRRIPPGMTVKPIAGGIDLLPTLVSLAGIDRGDGPPLDGRDMSYAFSEQVTEPPPPRVIYSHHHGRVSARDDHYRLDASGRLHDMQADPGQQGDVAAEQPDVAARLHRAVARWRKDMCPDGKRSPRPFPVGHPDWPITELPARDAAFAGEIKRSSVHPNCSYLLNWTSTDDRITWDVEVLEAGRYEAIVGYTCKPRDVGATIELRFGNASIRGRVTEPHDPPVQGERENRVQQGESFVKDFKPLPLGIITLPNDTGRLSLRATRIPGTSVIEMRRLVLIRVDESQTK